MFESMFLWSTSHLLTWVYYLYCSQPAGADQHVLASLLADCYVIHLSMQSMVATISQNAQSGWIEKMDIANELH